MKTPKANEFMQIIQLPYEQVPISGKDLAYINEIPALQPFFKYPVRLESFRQIIEDKQKEKFDRQLLVEVIKNQYWSLRLAPSAAQQKAIDLLALGNTFTVVTAHQPSLFTGPLYYIFKIISTLNLVKQLAATYSDFNFVPIFITSGEDHDFAELNHLHIFGKTLTWENNETGAVGNMKTAGLHPVLDELKILLGNSPEAEKIYGAIEKTHQEYERYSDAAFAFVQELFKDDGLVILNTNDARLKRMFAPIIRDEIFNQTSYPIVNQTIERLETAGFPAQATPREINFFYLKDQIRERIVREGEQFKVLNTDLIFSAEHMAAEVENHPERFSPNVVIRPLFQEKILPNLAYIGGGGEIAYWLERRAQFEHYGINFPMLVRRNSAMWIDQVYSKRMDKLNLSIKDLWLETEALIKTYLQRHAGAELQFKNERESLESIFKNMAEKAEHIDPTLVKAVWAEHAKALKSLEQIETRLVRSEKQKHENSVQQIRNLKEKLFPGNGLQERYDNFLPYYLKYGEAFFAQLKEHFEPMEKRFVIFRDV